MHVISLTKGTMSTTEPAESEFASTPATSVASTGNLRPYACQLCQRRKVRCDRREPCAACTKSRADCVFKPPAPTRRRPRKSPEAILLTKLRRYEDILKKNGVRIDPPKGETDLSQTVEEMTISKQNCATVNHEPSDQVSVKSSIERHRKEAPGKGEIIMKNGKTRYLENPLWKQLSDDFMDASEILPVSSEDEDTESGASPYTMDPQGGDLLLGYSTGGMDLIHQHPNPYQGFRLWQAFLDNVNPLTKIIHAPTMQQEFLEATGNLDNVSRAMEALMFAIYSSAVYSMDSAECELITGESQSVMLTRMQCATRDALIRAGLLKSSNLMVLQAFMLFLMSMRHRYDSHTLWMLAGVATRLAQRIGLHRDGLDLKLPPFETEMRRRLWWSIIVMEARAGEFCDVGQFGIRNMTWTTQLPLNINDSSLYKSMVELPTAENGATEMIHCLIRYEIASHMRSGGGQSTLDGSWQPFNSAEISIKDKEKWIQNMERKMQERYQRYCDTSVPLHFISKAMVRSAMCKMRFRAYHPRHHWARKDIVPQQEKDMLFAVCIEILEVDNAVQSNSSAKSFLWHVKAHFQFDALIHVLTELRTRPADETTTHAWQQVDEIFQHHPQMLADPKKGLHLAISRLAVRAWENYERSVYQSQSISYQVQSPHFREVLASRRSALGANQSNLTIYSQAQPTPTSTDNMDATLSLPFDFNSPAIDQMDWAKWDDLVQDFELNPSGLAF